MPTLLTNSFFTILVSSKNIVVTEYVKKWKSNTTQEFIVWVEKNRDQQPIEYQEVSDTDMLQTFMEFGGLDR
jgi:hypothetical protein